MPTMLPASPSVTLETYALSLFCPPDAEGMTFAVPEAWLVAYLHQLHWNLHTFLATYTYDDAERIAYAAHADQVLTAVQPY